MLDEPNSNLDAAGEQALAETLKKAKAAKVTTVVITQRPALLNIVDKVLILNGGRLEGFGTPNEVLHRIVKSSPQLAEQVHAAEEPALLKSSAG